MLQPLYPRKDKNIHNNNYATFITCSRQQKKKRKVFWGTTKKCYLLSKKHCGLLRLFQVLEQQAMLTGVHYDITSLLAVTHGEAETSARVVE